MAKHVVLGGICFSGQDFVDLLLDDPSNEVISISRSANKPDFMLRYSQRKDLSRFRFYEFDMNRNPEALLAFLDAERPEYVTNFVALSEVGLSWTQPEHWMETNAVANARLTNHLARQKYVKRYLHISTPEAYGNCEGLVTETTPDNPSTPYAVSKAAADMLNQAYFAHFGLPVVTVRATNVYGAHQQLFKIICRAAIYIKLGRKIRLDGGGVSVKSFIHIRDVSRGELAILERGKLGERYHLSPDKGIAVRDVVRTVCEQLGYKFEDSVEIAPERLGQDAACVIDSTKARTQLGWMPQISFEDGVTEVIRWINDNWAGISKHPLEYQHRA